jgi:hypothetical protein
VFPFIFRIGMYTLPTKHLIEKKLNKETKCRVYMMHLEVMNWIGGFFLVIHVIDAFPKQEDFVL